MYGGCPINMNYWKNKNEKEEEEKRIMEDWIPWTLIKIKHCLQASGDAKVFLLRRFTFDPKKFNKSYKQYKWEIIRLIPDNGQLMFYLEPVFKNVLLEYTRNKGKRVRISEEDWARISKEDCDDECEEEFANERYDKIATMFENGTALSYDQSHYGRLTNNNRLISSHHGLTNNNRSPNNNRVKQSRHASSFSNNISYDVKGRLSASRVQQFLPSNMTPMNKLSVDDLTKRYKKLIEAYKHIRDDVPAHLPDITIHAMARGIIYEKCALYYLEREQWCLQHERFFKPVTHMDYQPDYKETREHSYQESPQKKRSGQIMDRVVQDDLNRIKELGLYKSVSEQWWVFGNHVPPKNKYQYKKMHETCFEKDIPVLPDALCMFRGKETVVEVKCPTKHYTPSKYRGFIPQMTLEMHAYGCSQCLFVEYVTDTYKEDGGTSSVRVRLLKYNKDIMEQLLICFKALEAFSLEMQYHKKVTKDLPNDFDVTNPEHYDIWKDHEHFKALKESLHHLCMMFEILNEFCKEEAERYDKSELKKQDFSHLTGHLSNERKKEEAQKPKRKNKSLRVRPRRNKRPKRPKTSHDNHLNDTFDKLSIRF